MSDVPPKTDAVAAEAKSEKEERLDRSLLFEANESALFFAILGGILW